jgi:hypothetical protein
MVHMPAPAAAHTLQNVFIKQQLAALFCANYHISTSNYNMLLQGGCGVGRPFFHVTRCADDVGGGFSTDYGVRCCRIAF